MGDNFRSQCFQKIHSSQNFAKNWDWILLARTDGTVALKEYIYTLLNKILWLFCFAKPQLRLVQNLFLFYETGIHFVFVRMGIKCKGPVIINAG